MESKNNLPDGWKWERLENVTEIILGQSPPSSTYNTEGIGLPFFQGKAEFTELYPVVSKWCSVPKKIAEPNDILLSVRAPVGPTNIANLKCCIGRGLAAIRYKIHKYIFYYLRSIGNNLEKFATGSTFSAISGTTIRNLSIPIAPETKQIKIVNKIEELFSEIDDGVETLKKTQAQLTTYRQAVLKYAFEGRLTNENVKEGELLNGWKWIKIDDVCEVVRGGSPRPAGDPKYFGGDIPWITVREITKDNNIYLTNVSDYLTKEGKEKSRFIGEGTFLLTNSGATLGVPKISKIGGCINDGSVALLNLRNELKYFLYYFLTSKTKELRMINQGAAQPNLNTTIVKNIELPLPCDDEIKIIVQEIETRLSLCDELEKTIEQSLKHSEQTKQSILKKAFEGKLV